MQFTGRERQAAIAGGGDATPLTKPPSFAFATRRQAALVSLRWRRDAYSACRYATFTPAMCRHHYASRHRLAATFDTQQASPPIEVLSPPRGGVRRQRLAAAVMMRQASACVTIRDDGAHRLSTSSWCLCARPPGRRMPSSRLSARWSRRDARRSGEMPPAASHDSAADGLG